MITPWFNECLSLNILTVGSDPDCDIQLDIPNISSKHLSILSIGHEQFEIKDLGSFGGTYFNGRRITEAVVSTNDVIQVGHTPVRVAQACTAIL